MCDHTTSGKGGGGLRQCLQLSSSHSPVTGVEGESREDESRPNMVLLMLSMVAQYVWGPKIDHPS